MGTARGIGLIRRSLVVGALCGLLAAPVAQPSNAAVVTQTAASRSAVVADPGIAAVAVTGGSDFLCAITASARVACWGSNSVGQLGSLGAMTGRPRFVTGLANVTSLSARARAACAVASGSVWCWGSGRVTRAGATPAQIGGLGPATRVSVGRSHACALLRDATLWCWGAGTHGEIGNGQLVDSPQPVRVLGAVRSVSTGDVHTCAATISGSVLCWGGIGDGGGSSGRPASSRPRLVPLPSAVSSVASGPRTACAITASDRTWCWGANSFGEAGLGAALTPVTVGSLLGLSSAVGVVFGERHACALRSGRPGVWCWGDNGSGQLGDVSPDGFSAPELVDDTSAVSFVGVGDRTTCFGYSNGALRCRGLGYGPQLTAIPGLRTAPSSITPLAGVQRNATADTVSLRWSATDSAPFTVESSLDDGATWTSEVVFASSGSAAWRKSGLATGTAVRVRVTCQRCVTWEEVVSTTGLAQQPLRLVDGSGAPVMGIAVALEGRAQVTTDADGRAILPAAAPGYATVTADGAIGGSQITVHGSWQVLIGTPSATLALPPTPERFSTRVLVSSSSGAAVSGADVVVAGVSGTVRIGDVAFTLPRPATVTDDAGVATIDGFRDPIGPSRARPARVLLVGDSHAAAFVKPFARLAHDQGWQSKSIWIPGCSWIPVAVYATDGPTTQLCQDHLRSPAVALARDFQPDLIVLITRSLLARTVVGALGPAAAGTDAWRAAVAEAARRQIDEFASVGRQIVIIEPIPETAESTGDCITFAVDTSTCGSARTYLASRAAYVSVVRGLADPGRVATVDLTDLVCPEPICPETFLGIPIRRDTHHLTRDYVDAVRESLESYLEDRGVSLRTGTLTSPSVTVSLGDVSARAAATQGADVAITLPIP